MTTDQEARLPERELRELHGLHEVFHKWHQEERLAWHDDADAFAAGWRAARLAAIEECAQACLAEHVGNSVEEDACLDNEDEAYNTGLRHAAAAIRSLKGE